MTTLTAVQKLEEQIDAANSDIRRTQLLIDKAEASAQDDRVTTLYDLLILQQKEKVALQERALALQEEKTALQQKEISVQQAQAQCKHRQFCHNSIPF